jgi:hypothetical protein
MLVIGCFGSPTAQAQNLEAGKSAGQIFSSSCTACHKSARGLLRTVAPGSLAGFLREHYTTSPDMAKMLSAYLISNGAADARYQAPPARQQPGDLKPAPRSEPEQADRKDRAQRPHDAAKPDGAQEEFQGRKGRHGKRLARPGTENPEAAKPDVVGSSPKEAGEHGLDERRRGTRQKLGKRGKHGRELPKTDSAGQEPPKGEPAAKPEAPKGEPSGIEAGKGEGEAAKGTAKGEKAESPNTDTPKADAGKTDVVKPDVTKPDATKSDSAAPENAKSEDKKPENAKPENGKPENIKGENASAPKAATPLRADPVPAVTPAPRAGDNDAKPPSEAAPSTPSGSEAKLPQTSPSEPSNAAPPAKQASPPASVPPPAPPDVPAGSPVPPISK